MQRTPPLENGEFYHIFNRSIAKFIIFNNPGEYERMFQTFRFYQAPLEDYSFSRSLTLKVPYTPQNPNEDIEIIAYCLMPTHYHFVLKQNTDNGIAHFIRKTQNSYAKYFNLKYKRNGPLWASRFKNVLVETDEQLLHLTRYVHLNPVTARIIENSSDWTFSSFNEYTSKNSSHQHKLCSYKPYLDISAHKYIEFVEEGKEEQIMLAQIKHLMLD